MCSGPRPPRVSKKSLHNNFAPRGRGCHLFGGFSQEKEEVYHVSAADGRVRIYDNLDRPSGFARLALDTVTATAPPAVKFSLKAIYQDVACNKTEASDVIMRAALF